MFFKLLTGRVPEDEDLKKIANNTFTWESESEICAAASPEAVSLIEDIEKQTLNPDPSQRKKDFKNYISTNNLARRFAGLYGITAGDDKHFEPLHDRMDSVSENVIKQIKEESEDIKATVKKNSHTASLFGTKKRKVLTFTAIAAAAVIIGFLIALGAGAAGKVLRTGAQADSLREMPGEHVVFELAEADHDYETGLENWRRLDYNKALRDISAAYKKAAGNVSPDSEASANINNSLGCLYLDMGRYEAAYESLNDALAGFKNIYSDNDTHLKAVRFSIAQYDYLSGDTDTALKSIQRLIDEGNLKNDKTLAAAVLSFQGGIYDELGEYEKAVQSYENVSALFTDIMENGRLTKEFADIISDSKLSENERDEYIAALETVLETKTKMARTLILAGDLDRADELLAEALDTALENVYIGRKNLVTSKIYIAMAESCLGHRNIEKGLDYIDQAERIQKNLFDYEEVYPGLVEAYLVHGDLLLQKGNLNEAYILYSNAINLAENSFGTNHPETAEAIYKRGTYYTQAGLKETAKADFEKAIETC